MGILKGIIDRFRAMGKSEKEISGIIETAADKATANPDVTKPEKPKEPEMKIETTAEALRKRSRRSLKKPCYILKIIVKWNDTSTRQYQRPLKCRI